MLVNTKARIGVFSIALGAYLPQFPSLVLEFEAQYADFKKLIPDAVEIVAVSYTHLLLPLIRSCFPTSSSKSFNCLDSGGCVIFKVSAARVMLSSLATARKYCNTRISKSASPFLIFVYSFIIVLLSILFKYGNSFNICI